MKTPQITKSPSAGPAFFRRLGAFALGVALLAGAASAQEPTRVPFERIRDSGRDAGNWLTYGGNYSSHRHSTLTEITPANVANLKKIVALVSKQLKSAKKS